MEERPNGAKANTADDASSRPRGLYYTVKRIEWLHRVALVFARSLRLGGSMWERARGLDFSSWADGSALGYAGTENYHYQPCPARTTRSVLETLAIAPTDSIVDIGCGKGNALRIFAVFPFREIAGLELSPELCRIARSNMHRLGMSDSIEVLNVDATSFAGYGRFTVFFMFNPFGPSVMRNVLRRIVESPGQNGTVRIVYANPVHEDELVRIGARLERRFRYLLTPPVHVYSLDRAQTHPDSTSARISHIGGACPGDDSSKVDVVPADFSLLTGMALCHTLAFPIQFASVVGVSYLAAFYRTYLKTNQIAIAAVKDREVVGVLVGGNPTTLERFRRRAMLRYAPRILLKLLTDRRVFASICRALAGRFSPEPNHSRSNATQVSLLQVIAVRTAFRGTGIAERLMDAFESECLHRGSTLMRLTVDPDNSRAIAFYRKVGWKEVAANKTSLVMEKDLGPTVALKDAGGFRADER